jgi:hypothetical protein
MNRAGGWSGVDVALFCLLVGVAATFAGGYTYGELNHVEHLPMIFRAMDAAYLPQDFFVGAVDEFNPRFYYVWLMATAGSLVPLPVLFLVLTCLANVAIAAVTWHIARRMSPDSELAAALACCTVLAVDAFSAGGAAQIPRSFLEPSLLARPVAMLALWWTLAGEALRPVLLFVPAMALHPLVGAETAAVALAAAGAAQVIDAPSPRSLRLRLRSRGMARLVAVGAVLGAAFYLLYGGGQAQTLTTERFIHILAETRAPHHLLPSQFGAGSHLAFAMFCLAALLAWMQWRRDAAAPRLAAAVLAVGAVVVAACIGGYLFVEVFPTRLWTVAQPFRMTYLVKWLGLVLFAHVASRAIRSDRPPAERISGSLLVLGTGRFQPAIALVGQLGIWVSRSFGRARRAVATAVAAAALLVAVVLALSPFGGRPGEPFALAMLLGIAGCFLFIGSAAWRRLVPAAVVGLAVLALVAFRSSPALGRITRSVGVVAPRMSLSESTIAWTEAARFARAGVPEDAVFVVPPRLGGFRLIARRAVVVDSKAFPFGDVHMQEWYDRMLFTYAGRAGGELPGVAQIDRYYAAIDADHLARLRERYGATHALLWRGTETGLPVLYEGQRHRIVRIEER